MRRIVNILYISILAFAGDVYAAEGSNYGLRVTQSVTGVSTPITDIFSEKVTVNFGASKSQALILNNERHQRPLRNNAALIVPVRNYGDGAYTKDMIIKDALNYMNNDRVNRISIALKLMMAQGKMSNGVFVFEQQVKPIGVAREMKLSWSVTVVDGGKVISADPKIVDADPTIVYMLYTSLATDSALPSTWKWSDGGILQWQLRRKDGTPTTAWSYVNTGGAFDEKDDDSDFKVKCLAYSNRAGCPVGYWDAKTLVDQTSSIASVIDYVRKVEPMYDQGLNDPSTGEATYVPRMAVSYDRREYDKTGCTSGNYRNIGRKGYTLKTTIDRYQVIANETEPMRMNRFESESLSPTENFDISKNVTVASAALNSTVLDSFAPGNLVSTSDVIGLQYVSPISTSTTLTNANNVRLDSTQSDMAMNWVAAGSGNYNLYLGTFANNYWSGYGAIYDRSMSFNMSNTDIFSKFALSQVAFDDYMLVMLNGFVVHVGPFGGDRLEVVRQGRGVVVKYCETCLGRVELSTEWNYGLNVDLRPYLKSGQNTIFMRTIVGGAGEGALRIDATSCLAD